MQGFQRVVRVRRVTFADGSVETLARFIDVPEGVPPVARGYKWLDDSAGKAERCRRVAEARARKELRWAVRSIEGDHLLTCTFRENVQDIAPARRVWSYFIKLVKAKYPAWQYVAVMELQERGAIHFHAAVKGYQDVKYLRTCWLRASGDFGGNIDVRAQVRRWGGDGGHRWSRRRLTSYLGKYLGKAFEWMPKHSQRFTATADRPRPRIDRWWIEYALNDAEIFATVYRATCGERAHGVDQWLSPDGAAYVVSSAAPPFAAAPF